MISRQVVGGTGSDWRSDYARLPNAAAGMGKADNLHLKNVTFRQGEVGTLPYVDDTLTLFCRGLFTLLRARKLRIGRFFKYGRHAERNVCRVGHREPEKHSVVCLTQS